MKATITIKLDGPAFDNAGKELARILRRVAQAYESTCVIDPGDDLRVMDHIGQPVGWVRITGRSYAGRMST